VNVFVSEIEQGRSVSFELASGRQAYMVQIEGSSELTSVGVKLDTRDGFEIFGPVTVDIEAKGGSSHVILIEMVRM
jgi:redox-sensitive bicupin YhaK (pirin superfamily)